MKQKNESFERVHPYSRGGLILNRKECSNDKFTTIFIGRGNRCCDDHRAAYVNELKKGDLPSIGSGLCLQQSCLMAVITFAFYYLTNLDRNWTSLWALFLVVTIAGVVFATGKERSVKIVLVLSSIGRKCIHSHCTVFQCE